MSKSKTITAIELGSSKIVTLIASVDVDPVNLEKTLSIVGVSSVDSKGIKRGQIVDLEDAVEASISSVEAAERMAGYNINEAYVALDGASISSQNSHGVVAVSNPEKEIGPEDIGRVIEAASAVSLPSSRELIKVIPREFIVDGEVGVRDPISMTGVRLEVNTHIITCSSATVKNLQKTVNEVGININEFVYSGLASAKAVLTKTEKELGCVLVDIGGGTTSIIVYVDGAVAYSSVLPIGAINVTNDLAIGLQVSLETAEKIKLALSNEQKSKKKVKAGSEEDDLVLSKLGLQEHKKVSKKTLTDGIIRPRLNEVFTMIRLQLEKERLKGKTPSGIIITGGGANTVGIIDCARRMTSLPVRIGKPKGVTGLVDDIMTPAYATPIGLLLYALEQDPEKNLTSLSKKLKLPGKGSLSRVIDYVKDLLP